MPAFPFTIKYCSSSDDHLFTAGSSELFFILSGNADVIHEDDTFHVIPEDIFFINSNDTCHITGKSWEAVSISFSDSISGNTAIRFEDRFKVCSTGNTYSAKFDFIRYCVYHLVRSDNNNSLHPSYVLSIFYALLDHLAVNFSASDAVSVQTNKRNLEKLSLISEYINVHFKENLTLSQIADHFGLTSPYLSSFFKKYTNTTFSDYYKDIRLDHALGELISTSFSLEDIASDNGFSDTRSFSSAFRKKYGQLPSIYRKSHKTDVNEEISTASDVSVQNSRQPLYKYPSLKKYGSIFREKEDFFESLTENPRIIDAGSIDFESAGKRLTHNYRNMICIGSAKQLLYKEVQDMLIRAQREIGFRHVKFHGLLSDDMMVYHEDSMGNPHYSFTLIDKAFDFLRSIDMCPLCQLSFMPIEMAEDPWKLVDSYHYNTSPPKDPGKWTDLISSLVNHLVKRYGSNEVSSWLFCVWNEPDDTVQQFAWPTWERFFEFYEITYKTVKAILPDVKFGTPSMLLSIQKEYGWAADFFRYASAHSCPPDFLNIHYYDNQIFDIDIADRTAEASGFSAENMATSFPLTVDQHAFRKFIDNIKALARRYNMKNLPIYLTEWNLTISHRDLINDTCFKSCHLIKNLLENYDRLSSFSYWCLTDYIEELQLPGELYHGGLGLFTFNGIPKANYSALLLLKYLGNELLSKGDGYFITKGNNRICAVFYNYEHYSKLYASGSRFSMTSTDRYSAFEEMSTAQAAITITGLNYKDALITEYYVNQLAGSSFDTWSRMKTDIDNLGEAEYEILHYQSKPGISIHHETIVNKSLSLHVKMLPLEVRVITIKLY